MFERFNLRDTAFPVTPTDQVRTAWYGFTSLRASFEAVFERSTSEQTSLCVLNRGRLGAGKTHAAKFFSEQQRNLGVVGQIYGGFIPIVIEAPKQPQAAFTDFTMRLMENIGSGRLLDAASNLRTLRGGEELKIDLMSYGVIEDVAVALARMTPDNLLTSRAYLSGSGTSTELRKLGVVKRIKSDHDYASVVKGMLYLLMHGQSGEVAKLRRIVLWLDEMEDLVFFATRYYLPFTQAIREVLDQSREHLTVMLNFTFAEPAELPAIENILGPAIMQRVNEHIVFDEPNAVELRQYMIELLANNRLRVPEVNTSRPFSDGAINELCEAANGKTPRFLNKLSDRLLREALSNADTAVSADGVITDSFLVAFLPNAIETLEDERA